MMCARCDQPLDPGEAEEYPIHGADGAGATVQIHKERCTPPPRPRTYTYSAR
jgi:hypothetical protein